MDTIKLSTFQYDDWGRYCFYYRTENNNYSWGWIMDDFGNAAIPYSQITGYGMYEAHNDYH